MPLGLLSAPGYEGGKMAKAESRNESASGQRMSLDQRIRNYLASGRKSLTPRQIRRAAHKAGISTAEVQDRISQK
jgi:hypothetical protein